MTTKNITKLLLIFSSFLFCFNSFGQIIQNDSVKIDYKKIIAYCLDGNITPALHILELYDSQKLFAKDLKFKTELQNRFKNDSDKSDFLESRRSPITELLKIYRDYWRLSLLDNTKSYDSLLIKNLSVFFSSKYQLHFDNIDRIFKLISRHLTGNGTLYIGERHPFKQYSGSKASYETENGKQPVTCFTHHRRWLF